MKLQRHRKTPVPLKQLGLADNQFVVQLSDAKLELHDRWNTIGLSLQASAFSRADSREPCGDAQLWLEPGLANRLIKETGVNFVVASLNGKFAVARIRDQLMTIERGLPNNDPLITAAKAQAKVVLAQNKKSFVIETG